MGRAPLIPGIKIVTYDSLASDTTNDYWWATGVLHVKPVTFEHPWLVANEFVTARLFTAIGIPIPAGEVGLDPQGRTAWVTTLVGIDGEPPGPEDPRAVLSREPDVITGMFVADVWVLNEDRHEHNVLSHSTIGAYAIDHDMALGGRVTGVPGALANMKDRSLGYHMLADAGLRADRLHNWGKRVQAVPRTAIERITAEGRRRGLYNQDVSDAIAEFVLHRQADIHRLVTRSLVNPMETASGTGTQALTEEEGELT